MRFFAFCLLLAVGHASGQSTYAPDKNKVLRYAFEIAETSLDPQKVADVYSNIVNNAIFDTPLRYDYLANPPKMVPNTLVALPDVSADYRTFTFRVTPGLFFADHPVFNGKKRELVAADYVFVLKRLFDPRLSSPMLAEVEGVLLGSEAYAERWRKAGKLDFDEPFEGIKALDKYTFQIKLTDPGPAFAFQLTDCRVACAMAREVVERYDTDIGSHPVGTGPYRISEWKRSSRMVLDYNANFREAYWDAEPNADDLNGQAMLKQFKGKRIPMVGRVEISIIEEMQPRLLGFLGGGQDFLWRLPEEFATMAIPNNKLAPNLAKQNIQFAQQPLLDLTYMYFNMEDKTVGGYMPEKVALRRAITLAYRTADELAVVRKNQAILAHTPYAPGVQGYDPNFRTAANEHNAAKANALLDMHGYKLDAEGWRTLPDGSPLVLKSNSTPTDRDKQLDEMWKRSMDDIRVKIEFRKARWPDLLKESYAGKLMMWSLGKTAVSPDAVSWLTNLYGPNAGLKGNQAQFKLAAFDDAYRKATQLPDSPERTKLYQEMAKLMVAYAPWKLNLHRIGTDMWHPHVTGFRRPPVQSQNWWRYIDIDAQQQQEFLARQ